MKRLKLLLLALLFIPAACTPAQPYTKEQTIAYHMHSIEGVVTKEPTCQEEGILIARCQRCGEVISTSHISKLNHYPGNLVIEQDAYVNQDQISRVRCILCNEVLEEHILTYNQIIAKECEEKGVSGRIVVPELGINTPFIFVSPFEYSFQYTQAIVDAEDTAALFFYYSNRNSQSWLLGDHCSQGFDKFYNAIANETIAYLVWPVYTTKYMCILSQKGVNTGRSLLLDDGQNVCMLYLSDDYDFRFIAYTCLQDSDSGKYVQICIFDRIEENKE